MATYCVTYSPDDDWGEAVDRFKTRSEANSRLQEARATGRFAQLVRWDWVRPGEGKSTVVVQVNLDR